MQRSRSIPDDRQDCEICCYPVPGAVSILSRGRSLVPRLALAGPMLLHLHLGSQPPLNHKSDLTSSVCHNLCKSRASGVFRLLEWCCVTLNRTGATISSTLEQSRAVLASAPGLPSVNAAMCTQAELSLGSFDSVYKCIKRWLVGFSLSFFNVCFFSSSVPSLSVGNLMPKMGQRWGCALSESFSKDSVTSDGG